MGVSDHLLPLPQGEGSTRLMSSTFGSYLPHAFAMPFEYLTDVRCFRRGWDESVTGYCVPE
jgi:hypothetical protein